jgi:hypothetical protein
VLVSAIMIAHAESDSWSELLTLNPYTHVSYLAQTQDSGPVILLVLTVGPSRNL